MENLAVTTDRASFWRGKRVLLTGHSGFKGSWLTILLHRVGADVTGISLPPLTSPNLYEEAKVGALCRSRFCDIRDVDQLGEIIRNTRPEIVFHLAAQPLVRASYADPLATFEINVMGTAHVLDSFRGLDSLRAAVMVTTDKVYRNGDQPRPYHEDDPLGGHDPYSASKAACEMVIASYRDCYLSAQGVAVASARAGNVIGGGDWSKDRLIPDAVRAWQVGKTLEVRHPRAVRPWQHVLEPLFAYLTLAQQLCERPAIAGAYNFGPDSGEAASVRDVIELARTAYGEGEVDYRDTSDGPHESDWLALDAAKAALVLGITPALGLPQTIERTVAWYRAHHDGADARQLCEADISEFEARLSAAPAPAIKLAG